MTIIYSGTPAATAGLTSDQAATLRTDLSEPSIQALGAALTATRPAVDSSALSAGVSVSQADDRYIITIPASAFSAAALTKSLDCGDLPAYTVVESCVMTVGETFAGITGPVAIEVGHDTDPNGFLVTSAVTTGNPIVGLADAELGVELTIAGRDIAMGYPVTAAKTITALATSSSGNLAELTAGSVTIVVTLRYVGP